MTINLAEYKRALSCFATGVVVVTSIDRNGSPVGVTINSFNSVSLDPPLILWSIANDAQSYEHFASAERFVVNILARDQEELAIRFSLYRDQRFLGVACDSGVDGIPILRDCAASFECKIEHRYDGGDHQIVVGRVENCKGSALDPLIYVRGQYFDVSGQVPGSAIR